MLECGRRFADDELPRSTWDLRRYFYAPRLGMRGIFRLTTFQGRRDRLGRGRRRRLARLREHALPRAAALLRGRRSGRARRLGGRAGAALRRGRADARRGDLRRGRPRRRLLREYGARSGVEDTYAKTRVGVFLGEPGKTVPDPFFGGAGPDRTGCMRCGRCMVGCPHGAKNTLVKNYLWLAERAGARSCPSAGRRHQAARRGGRLGLRGHHERPGAWLRRDRRTLQRARRGRSPRARSAPTGCCRAASSTARCRALGPARRARAHQLGGDPRRHAAEGAPDLIKAGSRSPARSTPTPTPTSRPSPTATPATLDEPALHAAGRRRHARSRGR